MYANDKVPVNEVNFPISLIVRRMTSLALLAGMPTYSRSAAGKIHQTYGTPSWRFHVGSIFELSDPSSAEWGQKIP